MSPVDHAAILKAKPILGRISLVLSCSTLAEVLDYSWFFDSVFDLLEGIFLLMSPDALAFLCVRRRGGSYISERFYRNLEGTALALIISALLILCWSLHFDCCIQFPVTCLKSILRHHRSNEWHFASFEFELRTQ